VHAGSWDSPYVERPETMGYQPRRLTYSELFTGWQKAFSANMEPGPSRGWLEGHLKQVYEYRWIDLGLGNVD
jgi:hypothetical protein